MEHHEQEIERTISLSFFFKILKKHWLLLLAVSLTAALAFGLVYGVGVYTPIYSSQSEFYVSNVSTDTFLYSSGQTEGAKEMVENCARFLRGSVVLDEVLAELSAEQSPENRARLNGMISIGMDATAAAFTVTVSSTDPEQNLKIARAIEKVLPKLCDEFNNQNKAPNTQNPSENEGTGQANEQSQMLKVINIGVLDQTPNNSLSVFKTSFLVGAMVLVFLYVLLAIIAFCDMKIYGKEDLLEKLPSDIALFGVIPHWSLQTGGRKRKTNKKRRLSRENAENLLIGRSKAPFEVSEAFRMLCTNVTFCSTGEKGCTIGVISSIAGSGKSFVMANLAISLSRLIGKKVLLIDADMRVPMQHRIFRLENKKGLSNLIAGQCEDTSAVLQRVDHLDIITAGTLPPNPTELLAGPNMEKLLTMWKQEYDYILVDLPPIGEVADALAVSRFVSGYLFVLRSGVSDARMVREECTLMAEHDAKIFGYVLTDVTEEHLQSGHYAKYSKYSKYSYQDRMESAKKRFEEEQAAKKKA